MRQPLFYRWLSVVSFLRSPYLDLPLLSTLRKLGSISNIEKDGYLKITKLTLSNGVKVILKSTDFKDNEILFSTFALGGTSLSSDADYESAVNAAALLSSGGLGNYNQTELNKFLSDKESGTYACISEGSEGINGYITPKDIETAMQLVYGCFAAVRKDTSVVKEILNKSRAGLANRGDNPKTVLNDSVSAIMGNYNIITQPAYDISDYNLII
ncbi:MAG: ptrA 1 [Mucilaginibacter sp.]|nr:ptrA 1 [Mucilaginibacter sp.]